MGWSSHDKMLYAEGFTPVLLILLLDQSQNHVNSFLLPQHSKSTSCWQPNFLAVCLQLLLGLHEKGGLPCLHETNRLFQPPSHSVVFKAASHFLTRKINPCVPPVVLFTKSLPQIAYHASLLPLLLLSTPAPPPAASPLTDFIGQPPPSDTEMDWLDEMDQDLADAR